MTVRLGISPIGWSNDDLPELGGDIPLECCLAEARAAGYEGIELGHKFPRDPAVLRPILERFRVALISGWYSGRLLERSVRAEAAAIEPHSSLLVAMGCTVLVYAETSGSIAGDRRRPLSGRPRLGAGDWHDFGTRLTELADHLSAGGIGLVYHHHMGTVIESESEIEHLMAVTGDTVGLLLIRDMLPMPAPIQPHSFGGTGVVSSTSTARMSGARCWHGSAPVTRAFSTPFSTVSSPCRVTAALIFRACSPNSQQRTTTAGWLSRPNRIPKRRRRSLMLGLVLANSAPQRRARA
jgi:hypothetical protein